MDQHNYVHCTGISTNSCQENKTNRRVDVSLSTVFLVSGNSSTVFIHKNALFQICDTANENRTSIETIVEPIHKNQH